ncbi:DUF3592 domain-containing protein [uncultured Methanolobus sp.]|uniref:DUF3592 domain-containing protein n=1 Tax=uncultured Methanolobus sp. TaxID=218300 RepID=UPI0029C7F4E9|nr:DUF3592 domain-containing protein [uncultured Methanolobus sp.]
MENQRSFSLGRIFSNDYYSDLSLSAILVSWAFYILARYFGYLPTREGAIIVTESHVHYELSMAATVTVLAIIFLVKRLLFFRSLYNRGVEITGVIDTVLDIDIRHRVEYKYQYQNVDYWRGNAIQRSTYRINNFQKGDEVILLVDPQNPKRAVIKDLYF